MSKKVTGDKIAKMLSKSDHKKVAKELYDDYRGLFDLVVPDSDREKVSALLREFLPKFNKRDMEWQMVSELLLEL